MSAVSQRVSQLTTNQTSMPQCSVPGSGSSFSIAEPFRPIFLSRGLERSSAGRSVDGSFAFQRANKILERFNVRIDLVERDGLVFPVVFDGWREQFR